MKSHTVWLASLCIWVTTALHAQVTLNGRTSIVFATVQEAREILLKRDDFVERMSPFDRAARMKTNKVVTEKEFLEFVGKNVLEWDDPAKQKITSALLDIQKQCEAFSLPFPKKVFMIKTTGDEEGKAAYTRANAIILPANEIAAPAGKIRSMICHELFHILSRANPDLREKLYAMIGFVKCGEAEFPPELTSRKITNPDAPANNHRIRLKFHGKDAWAIPILFSSVEKYDPARGGEFFDYLQFKFLIVEPQGRAPDVNPANSGRNNRLAGIEEFSGFEEQVGKNTKYIIHPEEILADNFALLLLERDKAQSPEIIKTMETVLKGGRI